MAKAKAKLDWLETACSDLKESREYRNLGSADFSVLLNLGDDRAFVRFEAFEMRRDAETEADPRDADLVLEMSAKDWNAYLRARKAGKGQTLLSLDLDTDGGLVHARDPLSKLKFERYNRSLQAFVDYGAALT